jgi:hypothetical protein
MKVPVFQSGIPEAVLKWQQHFGELSKLKNFTSQQSFKNATLLLSGPAKEYWNYAEAQTAPAAEADKNNNEHYHETMSAFMSQYFPSETASQLKKFLLQAKKPTNMTLEIFSFRI